MTLRVGTLGARAAADLDSSAGHGRGGELGVEHGRIREVPAMGAAFLAAFDPDGIAVELTAQL